MDGKIIDNELKISINKLKGKIDKYKSNDQEIAECSTQIFVKTIIRRISLILAIAFGIFIFIVPVPVIPIIMTFVFGWE